MFLKINFFLFNFITYFQLASNLISSHSVRLSVYNTQVMRQRRGIQWPNLAIKYVLTHNFLFSFSTVFCKKYNLHFWKKMYSFFFFFIVILYWQLSLLVFDNIIFSSDFLLFLFSFHSKALWSFGRNERTCWKDIKNTTREFVQMVHYKIFVLLLYYLNIYNLIILLQIFRISSFNFYI